MKNPNTPIFWNRKLKKNADSLLESPIYLHKNMVVIDMLKEIRGRLLDAGAGYGFIEHLIQEQKLPLNLYGIDISPVAINNLKQIYGEGFKIGRVEKIPFPKHFFDCVLLLDVLEHTDYRKSKSIYAELNRVIKKKGQLIISVPVYERSSDSKANGHLRNYSVESLVMELKEYGFNILEIKTLYAFRKMYKLKTLFVNLLPFHVKNPNLVIVLTQKK